MMAWLGIGVKVNTLPVVALGIGIGVDYGIYLYSRMADFLNEGLGLQESLYRALKLTGKPVMFTAATLAVGVATWIFSDLKFQADMGILLTFMFIVNMIGAILVTIVVVHFWRRARTKTLTDLEAETKPHPLLAAVTGVSAGFSTMVANAAGPIMVIYLLAMRLPKYIFMGTAAWYFFILNLFKVPFSYSLGLINANSLPISLALAPVAVAGALTGRVLIRHINQQVFELLALVLTFVAGLRAWF